MEERPNPDRLLKRVKEEEYQQKGGKFKIYLGAAPGVGKTYMMLHDALAQRERGVDVVVGIAESHGREEIESLLKNFEVLPRQIIEYKGQKLSEFDLDAALKRNPQLILVDEMAHTNAPTSRHKKRWQDIKELIDREINVYTTLNVQHIESLSDDVSQIIHAPVTETIPDSMLERADIIELVDLPPEDLLKRLQEGKVYFPQRAELAQKHFFRKGNLTALRELALRTTAQRVGTQVLLYRQGEGIHYIWPTKEKILVCVGPGPESINLIRAACRAANNAKADWMAVYVDTARIPYTEEERNHAIQHLRLAEQLGARTRILTGYDIVNEILNFSHEENVTLIMIWKHIRPRWRNLFRRNLSDEIVRHSGEIDVYIMTGNIEKSKKNGLTVSRPFPWLTYFFVLSIVILTAITDFVLSPQFQFINLVIVFLLAIIAITLLGQTRRQAKVTKNIENQTSALYHLTRRLSKTRGIDTLLEVGTNYIAEIFNSDVVALIPDNNQLNIRPKRKKDILLDEKEKSIAQWVFEIGQIAGLGTDTLPFSNAIYIPLLASRGSVGVLRIQPKNKQLFTPDQMRLIEACANQIALALEVDRLHDNSLSR